MPQERTTDTEHSVSHAVSGCVNSPVVVTVLRQENDYGAMTVEVKQTHETRQVVETPPELSEALRGLSEGSGFPLVMERLPGRGNCWRATLPGKSH